MKSVNNTFLIALLLLSVCINIYFAFGPKGTSGAHIATAVVNAEPVSKSNCKRPEINRDNIMILINEYRFENHLSSFTRDPNYLDTYADLRAEELKDQPVLTHETKYKNFNDWMSEKYGQKKTYDTFKFSGGEILAKDVTDACQAIQGWSQSPLHNEQLLSKTDSVMGIGIRGSLVVVVFGQWR